VMMARGEGAPSRAAVTSLRVEPWPGGGGIVGAGRF